MKIRINTAFEICRDNTLSRLNRMKSRAGKRRKAYRRFQHMGVKQTIAMNKGDRLLCRHGTSIADKRILTNLRKYAFPEVLDRINEG